VRPGGELSPRTGVGEVDHGYRDSLGGEPGRGEFGDNVGRDPSEEEVELARSLDRRRGVGGANRRRNEEGEEEEESGPRQDRAPGDCRETTAPSSPRSLRRRRKIRKATVPTAIQGVAIMRRIE